MSSKPRRRHDRWQSIRDETTHAAAPDPVAAVVATIRARFTTRRDLEGAIGNRASTSMLLNRHRALSKDMIRRLAVLLHLPESLLLQPYELAQKAG